MKPSRPAILVATFFTAGTAGAAMIEPVASPEKPFSAEIAAYSEYEFRGISQTSEKPAIQGKVDYITPFGLYVGAFASNSRWLKDTAEENGFHTDNNLEWDAYLGYRFRVAREFVVDVGYRHYDFPSSGVFEPKPNTDEMYVGGTWGPASIRYYYATKEAFGVPNSKHSDYAEAALRQRLPMLPALTLEALVGRQRYKNASDLDYTVWKAGASYDVIRNLRVGVYAKGTDAKEGPYTVKGKDWSRDRAIAYVAYTF